MHVSVIGEELPDAQVQPIRAKCNTCIYVREMDNNKDLVFIDTV